ncbi:MAG: hypothetical protein GF416_06270 [Candidatus Altiarchaeales archaeon]|nr:hypothetical protein [Candidatus Altiarchaeales archaeon]MBD3416721.1 hypothetical protein [Candidatus Altiarchaeales archaeon]
MRAAYVMLATMLLCGCTSDDIGTATTTSTPETVQTTPTAHEMPLEYLTVDISAFEGYGCVDRGSYVDCFAVGFEDDFDVSEFTRASDYLGGLSPGYQMLEAHVQNPGIGRDEALHWMGCRMPTAVKYLVKLEDRLELVDDREEFRSLFAPVGSRGEALGFAIAHSGGEPMFEVGLPEGYVKVMEEIPPTNVEEAGGLYKVRLYKKQVCGCGPHPYFMVEYLVRRNGEVSEFNRKEAYRNPEEDGLCVD